MIIKEIVKLKEDYQVILDNDLKLIVSEDILIKHNLFKGKVIDNLNIINEDINNYKIYKKARRYALYGKSTNQMIEYFIKNNVNNYNEYINKLSLEYIINDQRIIDILLNKNYSKLKLQQVLKKYLFDAETIDNILTNYDEELALDYIYNKNLNKYQKDLNKFYGYLIRLGFNEDLVKYKLNIF